MRILEKLKRHMEISRLRRHARRSPSPASFAALAERHLAHSELERALVVAESGLGKFPDSERLAQVRLFAKKKSLASRLRRLRQDVARRPSPTAYANLAQIYRELDSEDDALEIVSECAERFPLNEQPYLIQGEIRLERFLRDLISRDAELAESALAKVTRINAHNVKAHLLLAELYHLVGDVGGCRRHLRAVLTTSPTDRQVQDFLRQLGAEATGTEVDPYVPSLAERAQTVEEDGEFVGHPDAFPPRVARVRGHARAPRPDVDADGLQTAIDRLSTVPGFVNLAVVDRRGEILADQSGPAGLSRADFAELVKCIRETAHDASRRMDTGALVRAEIQTPAGHLMVVRLHTLTLAALYSEPLRTDRVWEMFQDFVARHLTTGKEVARA